MIRAKINDLCFSNILCDSGSNISCINLAYADKLGLFKYPLEPGNLRTIVLANRRLH